MTSKSGVHLIRDERKNFEEFLKTIRDAGAKLPVVHIVDSFGVAEQIKKFLPDTHIVGRLNDKDGQHLGEWQIEWNADPRGAAEDYYRKVKPTWDAHPLIDTWGFLNEVNNPFYKEQADFNIRMIELTDKPLCLWDSSVGTPDYWINEHLPYESVARSCKVAKASALSHVLGLHEYAFVADLLEDAYKNHKLGPHLVLRYRRLASYLESQNALIPIVLTEVGQGGGYRFVGNDAWMADMRWYDSEVRKDDYVESVAYWTLGKWEGANFENVLPELAEYIVAEHADEPEPGPEPSECKPRLRYKRVYHYIEHTDERPALFADRLAVWMESDKTHGTYGNSFDDALYGPGVDVLCIAYGIERDRQMEFTAFRNQYYPDARLEFKPIPDGEMEPPPPEQLQIVWPTEEEPHFITWSFGDKGVDGFHFGLDTRCARGTIVRAVADGVVSFIGVDPHPSGGFGLYIRMETKVDKEYKIYHGHLLEATVQVGATLRQGDAIALSDNTGNSSGDHHHLEVREKRGENWVPVDPMDYMMESEKPDAPPIPPEPDTHVPQAWLHLNASGLHPNDGQPFLDDIDMLKDARMDGFLFTTNSDIDPDSLGIMMQQTGIPPENVIIRIHKSGTDDYIANPTKYVEHARPWIDHGLLHGVRKFQLWNEPNLDRSMVDAGVITIDQMEWPHDAQRFAEVFHDVAGLLRAKYGRNILIAFPPMSPQPNEKSYYLQLVNFGIDDDIDWYAIHCYFSADGTGRFGIDSRDGGLHWRDLLEGQVGDFRPWIPEDGKPVWMTEFADNGDEPDTDRARRTAEYFTKQYPTRIKGLVCYISQDINFPKQAWNKNDKMIAAVAAR